MHRVFGSLECQSCRLTTNDGGFHRSVTAYDGALRTTAVNTGEILAMYRSADLLRLSVETEAAVRIMKTENELTKVSSFLGTPLHTACTWELQRQGAYR